MNELPAIRKARIITGVLFALSAVGTLVGGIYTTFLLTALAAVGSGLVAFSALKDRKDILCAVGFGLLTLNQVILVLMNVVQALRAPRYGMYSVYAGGDYHFSIMRVLLALLAAAPYVLMTLLALRGSCGTVRGVELPWFTPAVVQAALPVVEFVVAFLMGLIGRDWMDYYLSFAVGKILGGLVGAAVMLLFLSWLAGVPLPIFDRQPKEKQPDSTEDGYYPMLKHILLLIFTFGIWFFMWIYKRTRYFNQSKRYPKRTPVNQLLLCLFIPGYLLWWTYDSARRLDELMEGKGILYAPLTTLITVLGLLMPFFPPILLQERINAVIKAAPAAVTPETPAAPVSSEELRQFHALIESGILSEDEFDAVKRKRLGL